MVPGGGEVRLRLWLSRVMGARCTLWRERDERWPEWQREDDWRRRREVWLRMCGEVGGCVAGEEDVIWEREKGLDSETEE